MHVHWKYEITASNLTFFFNIYANNTNNVFLLQVCQKVSWENKSNEMKKVTH